MQSSINIQELLVLFRKKWYWIVAGVLASVLIAVLYTTFGMTEQYSATASILISNSPVAYSSGGDSVSNTDISASNKLGNNYAYLLKNQGFRESIAKEVNKDESLVALLGRQVTAGEINGALSFSTITDTIILNVYATTSSPELAMAIVNAVYKLAPSEIDSFGMGSAKGMDKAEGAYKVSPIMSKNITIAFVAGLLIVLIIIFLFYLFDNTVKGEDQLKDALDVIVLGEIPSVEKLNTNNTNNNAKGKSAAK